MEQQLEKNEAQLYNLLQQKAGFEVVTKNSTENQLRILGRVPQARIASWLVTMENLLVAAGDSGWNIDLSKQYVLRGQKLVYGWRVIVQAESVKDQLAAICAVISNAPAIQCELTEVALVASPNRNALRSGKGAQPIGGAVVGPMALNTMRTGG
jgi:hypothetical protein